MSDLLPIAPRLVFYAAEVDDQLEQLSAEHAALQAELGALVLELEATTGGADEPWAPEGSVAERAVMSVEWLCAARRESSDLELQALISEAERAAVARVAAAEAEAEELLAEMRTEVISRVLDVAAPTSVSFLASYFEDSAAGSVAAIGEAGTDRESAPLELRSTGAEFEEDSIRATEWDADADRDRAFWPEEDEATSIREAIAAPLVAVAPLVLALLVIVLVLALFI